MSESTKKGWWGRKTAQNPNGEMPSTEELIAQMNKMNARYTALYEKHEALVSSSKDEIQQISKALVEAEKKSERYAKTLRKYQDVERQWTSWSEQMNCKVQEKEEEYNKLHQQLKQTEERFSEKNKENEENAKKLLRMEKAYQEASKTQSIKIQELEAQLQSAHIQKKELLDTKELEEEIENLGKMEQRYREENLVHKERIEMLEKTLEQTSKSLQQMSELKSQRDALQKQQKNAESLLEAQKKETAKQKQKAVKLEEQNVKLEEQNVKLEEQNAKLELQGQASSQKASEQFDFLLHSLQIEKEALARSCGAGGFAASCFSWKQALPTVIQTSNAFTLPDAISWLKGILQEYYDNCSVEEDSGKLVLQISKKEDYQQETTEKQLVDFMSSPFASMACALFSLSLNKPIYPVERTFPKPNTEKLVFQYAQADA